MESSKKPLSKPSVIIIYLILFYTAWALHEFFGKPFLQSIFPTEHAANLFSSFLIKNLVWTLPALLLVKHFRSEVHIPLKEMFTNKFKVLPLILVLLGITGYFLITAYRTHGALKIKEDFGIYYVLLYILTGITEESVFRGWLLNATYKKEKEWQMLLLNGVMFLCVHFPIWIITGKFIPMFTSLSFLFIFPLSILFSLCFLKNRNIIPAMIVHAYWDILTAVF